MRINPKDAHVLISRSWLLATCPAAKYRDGKRALDGANRALLCEPRNAYCHQALAAAYAEMGDFDEAVRWQQRSMEQPQFRDDPAFRRQLDLYRMKKPYREE